MLFIQGGRKASRRHEPKGSGSDERDDRLIKVRV